MQAEAAGVEQVVAMNPILLKPTNDIGSQVIVNGEVLGTMNARDYFKMKKSLIPDIRKAYDQLDQAYDIIVIEGAGSPAEINLKEDDIVNMGMAKMVNAPVLLVGDIDRGGVFAQLYGTVSLLEPEEQKRVRGLIINKFRGDKTILDPGVSMLEELTGIPVIGVTPYLHVSLDDEDSLSERLDQDQQIGRIDIAVIRLPRISNFTDFNIFEGMEGVSVRYVSAARQLGQPDLIIIPGTKNTMRDLLWMRQNGLEAAVLKANRAGTTVFGVCGGYQMLGESISDPDGVEEGGTIRGMGLLHTETVFEAEKARTRVNGRILAPQGILESLSGTELSGYEIHMGRTKLLGDTRPLTEIRDSITGVSSQEGACGDNVYGSYVHGIFDSEAVVSGIVRALAARKGITEEMGMSVDYAAFRESQYDLLADGLRAHLDMEKIYQIMNETEESFGMDR
jgi:adenosylcobyric acid synthase